MPTDIAMWIMLSDVFVSGVQFSEDQIQVSYLENRKQQVDSAIMDTMMINLANNDRWRETFVAVQETLKDLIDDVLVHQRTEGKLSRTAAIKTPQERMLQAQEEAEASERAAETSSVATQEKEAKLRELLGGALGEVPNG